LCYVQSGLNFLCNKNKRKYILNYLRKYLNNNDSSFKNIQLNSYYNESLTVNAVDALMKNFSLSNLKIKKFGDNKYEVTNKDNFERIIFIRNDFLDSADFHQDKSVLSKEEYENITHEYKNTIFKNQDSARLLNKSRIDISGAFYTIFVINDEFKNLKMTMNYEGILENNYIKPNLIKIKCFNIRKQVYNSIYTNDIEVFQWNSYKAQNNHYFHEFENRVFIPLLSPTLNNLKFSITNEYDEPLELETGHPTILSVTLKKMNVNYKTFIIRLSPSLEDENSTPSSFKTILPNTYTFDPSWMVCLKSMSFPNAFKIFPTEKEVIHIYDCTSDEKKYYTL